MSLISIICREQMITAHKHCSSLHTSLLMQESISVMRDEGSEIFLISLDTRKACDTVWHEGLFFKLFRAGINRKIWRLLWYWYKSAEGIVICSGSQSDRYAVKQGVRQGGILSTHLCQLYISDLLFELKKVVMGIPTTVLTLEVHASWMI